VWFTPNEPPVATAFRVVLRKTGLSFSNDVPQLVRDEVVSIALSDGTKQHVSVCAPSAPSNFITSQMHTATKVEATIDVVATQLGDFNFDPATVTIGVLTLTPT
jgi:hypothetical protein